jgi:NAD(P)H-quinone oxidoreductase subunit H
MLRGSGVKWDLRKVDHYECYDELDWDIHYETAGDCMARYQVRIAGNARVGENHSPSL